MKWLACLLLLASLAWGQTTPNIKANIPSQNTANYGSLNDQNWANLDRMLPCILDGIVNTTFAQALTCAGSSGTIEVTPFAGTISGTGVTIPAGVTLMVDQGALISGTPTINGPIFAGNYQIFTGTPTLTALAGLVNVRNYGAKCDGVTDNLPAVNAAAAAATSSGAPLYFPTCSTGYYISATPSNLVGPNIQVFGDGATNTLILLGSGYLVDDNQAWPTFYMSGLAISGGTGCVRNRYTGTMSTGTSRRVFQDNWCVYFTGAGVSVNSSDLPNWQIRRNRFWGYNNTTTVCLALKGGTNGGNEVSAIENNQFWNCKISVKIAGGAQSVNMFQNDFTFYNSGSNRAAVWIVPQTGGYTNSGAGFNFQGTKFGNENLSSTDLRIVYADDTGGGTYFGDDYNWGTSASAGYISNHQIGPVGHLCTSSVMLPIVYSYTPNVTGVTIGPVHSGSTPFSYLLQYDSSVLPMANDVYATGNLFGPVTFADSPGGVVTGYQVTNATGVGQTFDPLNYMSLQDNKEGNPLTAETSQGSYTNLQTAGIASWGTASASTAGATDSIGGSDAVTVTYSAAYGAVTQAQTNTATVGIPLWIDFELKSGGGSPLSTVVVQVVYSGTTYFQRAITVPSVWRRFRVKWIPRSVPAALTTDFTNYTFGTTGTVMIGRVRVYQSYEPLGGGQFEGIIWFGSSASKIVVNGTTGMLSLNSSSTTAQAAGNPIPLLCTTVQKSESAADTNVLTCTPPAVASSYRLTFNLSLSAASSATLGWTATWTDSNGTSQTPTNLPICISSAGTCGATTGALSTTATASGNYGIDINSSATNIVIKLTFSGTSFTAKATATIERII